MIEYNKPLTYQLIDKKQVYKGKRVKIEEHEYLNGSEKVYREHVLAGNAVIILPITDNNEVIMIQEALTPINKIVLSLPAGQIEDNEIPINAAYREVEEETGYKAKEMVELRQYYASGGYSNEKIIIFLAKGLIKTKQSLDESEDIKVIKIPMKELKELLRRNEIMTASATVGVMHYLLYC